MVVVYGSGSTLLPAVPTTRRQWRELHRNVLIERRDLSDRQQSDHRLGEHTWRISFSLSLHLILPTFCKLLSISLAFNHKTHSLHTFCGIWRSSRFTGIPRSAHSHKSRHLTFPSAFNFLSNGALPWLMSIHLTQWPFSVTTSFRHDRPISRASSAVCFSSWHLVAVKRFWFRNETTFYNYTAEHRNPTKV